MSNYYPPNQAYGPSSAQNLQFYPSTYSPGIGGASGVSGHATPAQASYGYGGPAVSSGAAGFGTGAGFGGPVPGVSGRMGEQGGLRTGWLAAFSTEGYDGEPPLLEELGVNFHHIQSKTLAVLNPFSRIDQHLMDDSDITGPILFFLLFGTFLLFSGRVHFGYIYGLALLGSISLHWILSLMTPTTSSHTTVSHPSGTSYGAGPGVGHDDGKLSSTLTIARSASVLGYCLLPLVMVSAVGVVMPMDTFLGICLTSVAIMWSTYSASGMFCTVGRMRGMRGLVAYPLALFYVGFGIMGIFSSRGSGNMAGKASL